MYDKIIAAPVYGLLTTLIKSVFQFFEVMADGDCKNSHKTVMNELEIKERGMSYNLHEEKFKGNLQQPNWGSR